MSDARRYAVWPDPRSRSRSRAYSRIKHRKSPIKGSRPSVPHGTNFFLCPIFQILLEVRLYSRIFTGWMPYQSHNQYCPSTDFPRPSILENSIIGCWCHNFVGLKINGVACLWIIYYHVPLCDCGWPGGVVVRVPHLRSTGRRFVSQPLHFGWNPGQIIHTHVPLLSSSINWYRHKLWR